LRGWKGTELVGGGSKQSASGGFDIDSGTVTPVARAWDGQCIRTCDSEIVSTFKKVREREGLRR
jgi:hypothetical protein